MEENTPTVVITTATAGGESSSSTLPSGNIFCSKSKSPRTIIIIFSCILAVLIAIFSSILYYYPNGITFFSTELDNRSSDLAGLKNYNYEDPDYSEEPLNEFQTNNNNGDENMEKIPKLFSNHNNQDQVLSENDPNKIRHNHLNEEEEENDLYYHQPILSRVIENRFMHLDLKGAVPKITFLKDVLRLAKESGLNGLIIEWEDAFPWSGPLRNLSVITGGYSELEVKDLINFVEDDLEMEIIPLIQTFGHTEFILKQEEFQDLRELAWDPQAICPSKNGTIPLIEMLIDQILEVHKNSRFIHIGCDEVWNLRMCSLCQESSESRDSLFLSHVIKVAKMVRSKGKIPIIWDDMLRSIPINHLNESKIGSLVEVMVWVYAEDIDRFIHWDVWDKYASIFPSIWAAAAFKGAFGETLQVPHISRHVDNVERWNEVINRESTRWKNGVGGLVLTGWQRYDHFSVLCEILPAAVPSLIYTSLVLSTPFGKFNIKNRILLNKNINANANEENDDSTNLNSSLKKVQEEEEDIFSIEANKNNATNPLPELSIVEPLPQPIFRKRRSGGRIPHPRTLMNKDAIKATANMGKLSGANMRILSERDLISEIYDRNEKISNKFHDILRCPKVIPPNLSILLKESDNELTFAAKCNFPGISFFRTLIRLRSLLTQIYELEVKINRKRGWVSPYNIRHNFSLPLRVNEVLYPSVTNYKRNLEITAKSIVNSLNNVFGRETILEWIEQNIWEAWKILTSLDNAGVNLKSFMTWERRPLKSPNVMIKNLGLFTLNEERDEL